MLPREVVQQEIEFQSQQKGAAAIFTRPAPRKVTSYEVGVTSA